MNLLRLLLPRRRGNPATGDPQPVAWEAMTAAQKATAVGHPCMWERNQISRAA